MYTFQFGSTIDTEKLTINRSISMEENNSGSILLVFVAKCDIILHLSL